MRALANDWMEVLRAALLVGFCAAPAHAEMEARTLIDNYEKTSAENRWVLELLVASAENGLGWANAALKDKKSEPLYCVPDKLALTGHQLIDILKRHVSEKPSDGSLPYALVLLSSLREAFPCVR
jgi:hypothetical protein